MNSRPQYDLAYSMLALDEPYARRLIAELKKRLRGEQYLYSRKNEDAEDRDLLTTFEHTFSTDSRLVVLLYRPGWGDTPFTAVEQEAIKARALTESGVRSIFVVAMQPPHTPEWYPEHEFWADADVYSVPQISAMIEFALAREPGEVAPETPAQMAVPMQDRPPAVGHIEQRQEADGSSPATPETELFTALAVEAAEITRGGHIRAACELTSTACIVTYNQTTLQLKAIRTAAPPYIYAVLTAWVNVSESARQSLPFGEWRLVQTLDERDEWMWKFEDDLLTPQRLARSLMERILELARADRSNPRIIQRSITPKLA